MPGSMKSNESHEICRSSQVCCLISNSVQELGEKTFQRGQNTDKNKPNFLGECKILLYHQKLCPEGISSLSSLNSHLHSLESKESKQNGSNSQYR